MLPSRRESAAGVIPHRGPVRGAGPGRHTLPDVKILLLENIHTAARDALSEAGFEVETRSGALDEEELIAALEGVDMVGIRSKTQVTARVLRARPELKVVGAFCIGTNQIDLDAAAQAGTVVFNAPFSNTRSVVELALAEIIALARHLTDKNAALHKGVWDKSAKGAHEVRGRTLGIIGYGNIGSQLSVVAEAFGMHVYFYDLEDKLPMGNAKKCDTLEELLSTCETITLHVDGRAGNAGNFGAEEFARMLPRSLFLNLSRGFVVDLEALRDNLVSGHIAGAAVDVFPEEPKKAGAPFENVLQGIPNVILTPHVGGSTEEAQLDIGHYVSGKLRDWASTGATTMSVNVPGVSAPVAPGTTRILHLHENVPGVLARVNTILSEGGANIDSQQLSTKGEYGYAVTDLAGSLLTDTEQRLRELEESVEVRVIVTA